MNHTKEITLSRRRLLGLSGGVVLAALLADCGSSGSTPETSEAPGHWTVGMADDPTVYSNRLMPGLTAAALRAQTLILEPLFMGQGKNFVLTPLLARSAKLMDETHIRISLRKNVNFHDGTPFTSADVKYTLDELTKDDTLSAAPLVAKLKETVVLDDHTCELVLDAADASLLNNLGYVTIVSKAAREDLGVNGYNRRPVGTGTYRLTEDWEQGKPIELEAFDGYWAGKQSPDRLTLKRIENPSTRTAALLTGDAMIVESLSTPDIPRIKESKKAVISQFEAKDGRGRMLIYLMNYNNPALADRRVREALNYGVDRQRIVKSVLGGRGTALAGVLPKGWMGSREDVKPWPYDPTRARQLLRAAGYGDGLELEWQITNGVFLEDRAIAEAVSEQLREIKVDLRLRTTERAVQISNAGSGKGSWGILTLNWPTSLDPDAMLRYVLISTGASAKYKQFDALRRLVEQGAETYSDRDREAIYRKLNMDMWEECPWLYVHVQDELYGALKAIDWEPVATLNQGTEAWYFDARKYEAKLASLGVDTEAGFSL